MVQIIKLAVQIGTNNSTIVTIKKIIKLLIPFSQKACTRVTLPWQPRGKIDFL